MNFFVDSSVFRILPDYCVGVVLVPEIDNHNAPEQAEVFLEESVAAYHEKMQGVKLKEDPRIEPYRNAFRLLNINPNKYMCSIEALAKRVQKKPELPHINGLVDLGNAVSLACDVPIGVHAPDKFDGDSLGVRFYEEGDHFLPMGGEEQEIPEERELLYVSGNTVKTRRWTWRQSDDGKITEDTCTAILVVDGFTDCNEEKVKAAVAMLREKLEEYYGIQPLTGWVDAAHNEFVW